MTSTDYGYSRFERWQPRNWSLAVKLAAVLLVPVLLGMALGVARIVEHTQQATALGALDRFVTLDGKAAELIDQLQRERDQAALFVANNRTGDKAALQTQFGTTDGKISELTAMLGQPSSLGGAAQTAYQQAKDNLDRLADLRNQATGGSPDTAGNADTGSNPTNGPNPGNGPKPGNRPNDENRPNPPAGPALAPALIAGYTGVIEPMLVFQTALDRQLDTPALAGPSGALSALALAKEQVALQHAVIAVAIARGQMLPADADTVRSSDAELSAAVDQYRAALDADQQSRFAGFISDTASEQRQQLKQTALSRVGGPRGQLGISPADWDTAANSVADEMRGAADGVRGDALKISAAQQDAARNASGIDSVILLLALVAAAAVVYLVGRSMLRPLRTLRSTALDIAERRLPGAVQRLRAGEAINPAVEPVPVESIDEIGQVARAFDEVHGQAVRLAAEQATLQTNVGSMFVNLSRRSQGLVERQLQLIEQLERNEQDAEQLANLFQLDHLATRMRRNSENLLVLAGAELTKRGSQPVPVVDVLRAAVSEIEQYQRVVVQPPPSVRLVGRAANDMVHLVAELLDNATAFSAPDTQVVVSSTVAPDGSLRVEIADQGVGMPGEELIAANNRLAGPTEVDVSASRRMGLFVVGRLAARHGVGVRLSSTDQSRGGGGITALVTIPTELVVADAEQPSGDRPRGERASTDRRGAVRSGRPSDERAFGATVADRSGSTSAVVPVTASGAVPRAGLASEAVPGGLANGAAVNGAGVNGAGVNGTAVGGGANGVGPSGLPRRSVPREPAAPAEPGGLPRSSVPRKPATPAESGGLPRRSAGVTLGHTAQQGPRAQPEQHARPGQQARPDQEPELARQGERAQQPQSGLPGQPARTGHSAQLAEASTGGGPAEPVGPTAHSDLARPPAGPAEPAHRHPEAPRRDQGWTRSDQPSGRPAGSAAGGPSRRYPKQPYLRSRAGQVPTPPPTWFNQRQGRWPTGQPGSAPVDRPSAALERPGSAALERPGTAVPERPGAALPDRAASTPVPPVSERPAPPPTEPPAGRAASPEPAGEPLVGSSADAPGNAHTSTPPTRRGYSDEPESSSADQAGRARPGSMSPTEIEPRRVPEPERMPRPERAELAQRPEPEPELSGRDGRSESPIFEEMASAWFRENLELDQGRDLSATGTGSSAWDAGEPLLRPMPEPAESNELTTAGLPKRRPRSQLIPGGPSGVDSVPSAVPVRSPEQVRGRLASYQQGVRQGRASRHRRPDTAGEHSAPENHWEENS